MIKKKAKSDSLILGQTPEETAFLKSSVNVRTSNSLTKSILNVLDGPDQEVERLAFEIDPTRVNSYANVYKPKARLLPDSVLKRIAIQDSLVANIVRARQNHMSVSGRPRPDRFSSGFVIRPNTGVLDTLKEQEKQELNGKIQEAVKLLNTCGHTEAAKDYHQASFSEYLSVSARDAVTVGRIATEIVYKTDLQTDEKKFVYFVATDAGTIYQAVPEDNAAKQSIREQAYDLIVKVTGKKQVREPRGQTQRYDWVQVIEGTPKQVFTSDEMKCRNFYPTTNYELDGYPVTPIDTVMSAVTTHINITTHNKMYFQSGRAARGMLVIKSDDTNPTVIHNIKQQFAANINGSAAAFRMPVFGISTDAEIQWQPMDIAGSRDMEFQYLTDLNAREILTAFMMSPGELPGWSFLSPGTSSQALSESNKEFQLTAARDVGIRPLLSGFEDFINKEIFPLIDPYLSKICRVQFLGLDADTPEKEIVNIQQNSQVWMTYNNILERVEQPLLDKAWCSEIPLNPVFKGYIDCYLTVGQIMEQFMGVKDASKDPRFQYYRDPLWFQWMQIQQQQQQMAMQQQQMQQPAPNGQQPADQSNQGPEDLARGVDQAYELMTKSEDNLSPEKRRILHVQNKAMKFLMQGFEDDVKDAIKEVLEVTKQIKPRK